jgi:hypothetical protein
MYPSVAETRHMIKITIINLSPISLDIHIPPCYTFVELMKNQIIALAVGMVLLLLPVFLCGSDLNHRTLQDCVVDSSGSDSYYVWLDIYEPGGPIYNWVDITGIGTEVEGLTDDNNVGPFPIGFDFPYYGYFVYQFWVNSNGAISFSDGAVYVPQGGSGFFIPSTNPPNDLLIPLGGDLTFETDSGECYYYSNNLDTFVVSYIDVPAWNIGGPTGAHSFQLMLTRQDSCIYFQYSKQEGQFYNSGVVAGIESLIGNCGIQVFSGAIPDSGYAIKFIPIDSASVLEEYEDREPESRATGLTVSPNPFSSVIRIELLGTRKSCQNNLTIYDTSGRLVKSIKLATSPYHLGADLVPGIYFLKVNDKSVGKVVKVR